jgi:type IV fimbrial biogenesis protein FimT
MARMPSPSRALGTPCTHRRMCGVTLIELSVALGVMALLTAIAIPSLQDFRVRQQANATMNLLVSHFASARMTAITHGVPVVVCPSEGAGTCRQSADWGGHWLSFRDPDGNRQPDEDIDIYRNDTVPHDPKIRLIASQGRKHIRYQPSGMSYGTNLTIRICYDGRVTGSVVLNNTGRARTVRGDLRTPC